MRNATPGVLALDRVCARVGAKDGLICTAHTIDDRVETFFMRALVGTGPGGLASIPRVRGNLRRPLLDASREQLRDWLRKRHPGVPDTALWREDETNLTGDNFRSRVRRELIPVLRKLRPGFEGLACPDHGSHCRRGRGTTVSGGFDCLPDARVGWRDRVHASRGAAFAQPGPWHAV